MHDRQAVIRLLDGIDVLLDTIPSRCRKRVTERSQTAAMSQLRLNPDVSWERGAGNNFAEVGMAGQTPHRLHLRPFVAPESA